MDLWGFILQGVTIVATAGAVYGGIRADVRAAHDKANDAHESACEAHQRIDNILLRGK